MAELDDDYIVKMEDVLALYEKPYRSAEPVLHDALEALSQMAPRQAKVVELRYFGGLNVDEIVEVLKVSPRTVERDWEFARVWLMRELGR